MQDLRYALLMLGLGLIALYHVAILVGAIGYKNVWGGKITHKDTVMVLESVALGVVLLAMLIVWQSAVGNYNSWVHVGIWSISGLFFLSAFANLFAENLIEKVVSVPLALGIGVLALSVALKPE